MISIAEVIEVEDKLDGDRIKAKLLPTDGYKSNDEIQYAFPLLPKFLHIKPKKGESVFIIQDDNNQCKQRYYVGPIISQMSKIEYDNGVLSSSNLLDGGMGQPDEPISNNGNATGCFANDKEVALYGRKNTDIILGNDTLRIRCSCRLMGNDSQTISKNRLTPSFIQLKNSANAIANTASHSTATVVADEINLIANNGDSVSNKDNTKNYDLANDYEISDKEMSEIIQNAHVLPYGDILVEFLQLFLQMFKSHTHKYHGLPPVADEDAQRMYDKFGQGGDMKKMSSDNMKQLTKIIRTEDVSKTFKGLSGKLLSQHVRIN